MNEINVKFSATEELQEEMNKILEEYHSRLETYGKEIFDIDDDLLEKVGKVNLINSFIHRQKEWIVPDIHYLRHFIKEAYELSNNITINITFGVPN